MMGLARLLFAAGLLVGLVGSEWVEMPQFSAQHRVYGQPISVRRPYGREPPPSRYYSHEFDRVRTDLCVRACARAGACVSVCVCVCTQASV